MSQNYGYNSDFDEKNYRKAQAEAFEESYRNDPEMYIDLIIVDELFQYYYNQDELDKANQLLECGLVHFPINSGLHFKKAVLCYEKSLFEEALSSIQTALRSQPLQLEYVFLKSEILEGMAKYNEAIDCLEVLISGAQKPDLVYLKMADIAKKFANYKDSQNFYAMALSYDEENENTIHEMSYVMEKQDLIPEAIKLYDTFLCNFPYSEKSWYNLGILYYKSGENEKAIESFDFAIAIQDDFSAAYFNKGRVFMTMQDYKLAIPTFLEVLALERDALNACLHIAQCYEEMESYKEACHYYLKVIKENPLHLEGLLGTAICLESLSRYTEAIHYYKSALSLNSENTEIILSISMCEYKLGNNNAAYDYLDIAIRYDPHTIELWKDWAKLLYEYDNLEGAITFLEEGIKHNPTSAELYYLCAVFMFRDGKESKGLMILENAFLLDVFGWSEILSDFPETLRYSGVKDLVRMYLKP